MVGAFLRVFLQALKMKPHQNREEYQHRTQKETLSISFIVLVTFPASQGEGRRPLLSSLSRWPASVWVLGSHDLFHSAWPP